MALVLPAPGRKPASLYPAKRVAEMCQKEKSVASMNDKTSPEYLAEFSVPRRRREF